MLSEHSLWMKKTFEWMKRMCYFMQLDRIALFWGTLLPLSVIYVSSVGHMYDARIIIVGFGSKNLTSKMKYIYVEVYTRKRINIYIFHRI